MTTIDAVLGGTSAYLKVDVEGAELDVLEGAREALEERRLRAIQLEWNAVADRSSIEALLREHGYDIYGVTPDGSLRPVTGDDDDILAVPG